MSFLDVYIGYSDDERFKWEGGDWSGNVPRRQSPFFPPKAPFDKLVDKVERGELNGKQVDWGAWAAKVDKSYIIKFFKESYDEDWYEENPYPPFIEQMNELKKFIEELDDTKVYILVASEL